MHGDNPACRLHLRLGRSCAFDRRHITVVAMLAEERRPASITMNTGMYTDLFFQANTSVSRMNLHALTSTYVRCLKDGNARSMVCSRGFMSDSSSTDTRYSSLD